MNKSWEDSLVIAGSKSRFKTLGKPAEYMPFTTGKKVRGMVANDSHPLPTTEDRENYHGDRHFDYWLSGLEDYKKITNAAHATGIEINQHTRVLDLGCASGRVIRHFASQSSAQVWGCDISENHVTWCNRYLSKSTKVFQNTALPHLQISDSYFDIVFAMSVFTHIESFETAWLCELDRILKPGGIAYVTIHDENSWQNMPKDWGVGPAVRNHPDFNEAWINKGFPGDKIVFRWHPDKSYSSNVFYKQKYIKRVWGKFFTIEQTIPNGSAYQTVLVLKKNK
jgi:2-polyprenyl-3-methyl-5-hydroxy-6-metoxy-1,4-benzoquinol methylase